MSEHAQAQAWRFVRVSGLAFLAAMATTGGKLTWSSLWALGAGALETGLRQMLPVNPIPAVSSVLAPAAAPSPLGLPTITSDTAATVRVVAPPPLPPMTPVEVPLNPDGTGTASNPAPAAPPGGEGTVST